MNSKVIFTCRDTEYNEKMFIPNGEPNKLQTAYIC